LTARLTTLVDRLLGREWPREDGTAARIEQLVVDGLGAVHADRSRVLPPALLERHLSPERRPRDRTDGPPHPRRQEKARRSAGSSPGTAKARADAEVRIGSSDFLERLGKVA